MKEKYIRITLLLMLIFFIVPLIVNGQTTSWVQIGADIDGEAADDYSGRSLSLSADGSKLAIGAYFNEGNGSDGGHVRVYEWNGTDWMQEGADINGEAAYDLSGFSVSLSTDGSKLAIGARSNDGNGGDAGHVRVYEWSGTDWVQSGMDIDGEAAGDYSGGSVSLSADGSKLAIGAHWNDGNGSYAGHVRVYEWNGTNWVQTGADIDGEATDDWSGRSVSLSDDGNTVAIGANHNDGNGDWAGHVRVYGWNGTDWVQTGTDIDGEATFDQSGSSVSLSADGSKLAIGAPFNDGNGSNAGHVRLYEWSGTNWVQTGADIDGEAADDLSGRSVSLSADGSKLAIGASNNDGNGTNTGHVRVYHWNGTNWVQEGADINGEAAGDISGYSVSLSAHGNKLAIGAHWNDGNGTDAGHVRVFNAPSIIVSPNYLNISAQAGTSDSVYIIYNTDSWIVKEISEPWLTINMADTVADYVTFDYEVNPTDSFREASVVFAEDESASVTDTLTILQEAFSIIVSPDFLSLTYQEGVTNPVNIIHNTDDWFVDTISENWLTINTEDHVGDFVTFDYEENTSGSYREAFVVIDTSDNAGVTDTLNIVQGMASQPFLMVSPESRIIGYQGGTTDDFHIIHFNISGWELVLPLPDWIHEIPRKTTDYLTFNIDPNETNVYRAETITIQETNNPTIFDKLTIIQATEHEGPFVLSAPEYKLAEASVQTLEFQIFTAPYYMGGTNGMSVAWGENGLDPKPEWILNTPVFSNENNSDIEYKVSLNIDENIDDTARIASFKIIAQYGSGNDTSNTSRVIQKAGASDPLIIVSPPIQEADFAQEWTGWSEIITFNIDGINELNSQFPDWIIASEEDNNGRIRFQLLQNDSSIYRQATLRFEDISDTTVYADLLIVQNPAPQLLASPREIIIPHIGILNEEILVTSVNIDSGWEYELPAWTKFVNQSDYKLIFDADPNPNKSTRTGSIRIFSNNFDPVIEDSVLLYQYSALDTFLLVEPREQFISHMGTPGGEPLLFDLTRVNIDPTEWEVVDTTDHSDPMVSYSVNPGEDVIKFTVFENYTQKSRDTTITIQMIGHPEIYDSLTIYQYSALDSLILAAPRERRIEAAGKQNVFFDITTVNIPNGWTPFENSDWIVNIANENEADIKLIMDIEPNLLLESRQDTVILVANGYPNINDTVIIFQYAAPDSFLLGAPREHYVLYEGDTALTFEITQVNIYESWNYEPIFDENEEEWIEVLEYGNNKLKLKIDPNSKYETRQDTIYYYANHDTTVIDSVFIYQYAAPEKQILAEPREHYVDYLKDTIEFDITPVNLDEGWYPDMTGVGDWIQDYPGDGDENMLSLIIDTNVNLTTRQDTVFIRATEDATIYDSVYIYQFSNRDAALLAEPREQSASHLGDDLQFIISAINIDGSWEVDETTVNSDIISGWTGDPGVDGDTLTFTVSPNPLLETRSDTVRIFAAADVEENGEVEDFIRIHQYSSNDSYLLAAPREQKVGFEDTSATFSLLAVNVDVWDIDLSNLESWLTELEHEVDDDSLTLNFNSNNDLATRFDTIFIRDSFDESIYDSVFLHQYSALDKYLIASPRERYVEDTGAEISFSVQRINVDSWYVDTTDWKSWIDTIQTGGDQLVLNILENTTFQSRFETIIIRSSDDYNIKDSVKIYQFAKPKPGILVQPREQYVPANGDSIEFQVTVLNLPSDSFAVDPLSITDTTWIKIHTTDDTSFFTLKIFQNDTTTTRQDTIVVKAVNDPSIRDSIFVYQLPGLYPLLRAYPSQHFIGHEGDDTVVSEILALNVFGWAVEDLSKPDWIEINSEGDEILELKIGPNQAETRIDSVKIFVPTSPNNPNTFDYVSITQPSADEHYFIIKPKIQHISFIGGKLNTPFEIIAVNFTDWDYEYDIIKDSWLGTIDTTDNELILNNIEKNESDSSRTAQIKVYEVDDDVDEPKVDSIIVTQLSATDPYLLIDPTTKYGIQEEAGTFNIAVQTNKDYTLHAKSGDDWYSWEIDSIGNMEDTDTVSIHVEESDTTFRERSSYLIFKSEIESISDTLYMRQKAKTAKDIAIQGRIVLASDTLLGIKDIEVVVGDDSDSTSTNGVFEGYVKQGWSGNVSPIIVDYYFDPLYWSSSGFVYDSILFDIQTNEGILFKAYEIAPKISLKGLNTNDTIQDTIFICMNDTLKPGDINYPTATVTGTYRDFTSEWKELDGNGLTEFVSPDDTLYPNFFPSETTLFRLVVTNRGKQDNVEFYIKVNPLPAKYGIDNPKLEVCKNQGGVIYQVNDYKSGEYFHWSLDSLDPGGVIQSNALSNIAVIDWGGKAGPYILTMETRNEYGCPSESSDTIITVLDSEAPLPTSIIQKFNDDKMLLCKDSTAAYYEWGWYTMENGKLSTDTILDGKNDWYCWFEGNEHIDREKYKYFVITYTDDDVIDKKCGSRAFLDTPVSTNEQEIENILVYPNPTDDNLNMVFGEVFRGEELTVSLFDLSGQQVYREVIKLTSGQRALVIDKTRELKRGLYILRVTSPNNQYQTKIIIR